MGIYFEKLSRCIYIFISKNVPINEILWETCFGKRNLRSNAHSIFTHVPLAISMPILCELVQWCSQILIYECRICFLRYEVSICTFECFLLTFFCSRESLKAACTRFCFMLQCQWMFIMGTNVPFNVKNHDSSDFKWSIREMFSLRSEQWPNISFLIDLL